MFTCKRVIIEKKKKSDYWTYLTPCTKINSKWNQDLNIRSKTVKFLKENLRGKLCDISLDTDFMAMTAKGQATKPK